MKKKREFEPDIEACSEFARPGRREFLRGASAAGALTFMPRPAGSEARLLPTVALDGSRVTRFIVGSNPVYGYSHVNSTHNPVNLAALEEKGFSNDFYTTSLH